MPPRRKKRRLERVRCGSGVFMGLGQIHPVETAYFLASAGRWRAGSPATFPSQQVV